MTEPSCEELQRQAMEFYDVGASDPHVAAYAFNMGKEHMLAECVRRIRMLVELSLEEASDTIGRSWLEGVRSALRCIEGADLDGSSCPNCGAQMSKSSGPGRVRSYRGKHGYEIPADLAFWICGGCSAEWMTADQIDQLSDAFEAQRTERESRGVR